MKYNTIYSQYCIIFDMDGVLADTGPIHFESWVNLGWEIGIKFTREFFKETFDHQFPKITRKLVVPDPDDVLIEEWANFKERMYREIVRDILEPLPGIMNFLAVLKSKGFKLTIGSSGPSENVDLLLTSLKIKEFFNVIITGIGLRKISVNQSFS